MDAPREKKFRVAAKGYIFRGDKVLVLYKTPEEAAGSMAEQARIDQPGGRVEFGESFEEGLLREIDEESGLRVRIVAPFHTRTFHRENSQMMQVDFLCEWTGGEVRLSEEHEGFEWLTLDEIRARGWLLENTYEKAFALIALYRAAAATTTTAAVQSQ